jgi:hypothetical protein
MSALEEQMMIGDPLHDCDSEPEPLPEEAVQILQSVLLYGNLPAALRERIECVLARPRPEVAPEAAPATARTRTV